MSGTMAGPVPPIDVGQVMQRKREVLEPNTGGSIAIYSKSGAGKSHFIIAVILPLCEGSVVVIIDPKGDDQVWEGIGLAVTRLPADLSHGGGGPRGTWWRLVPDPDATDAQWQEAAQAALQQIAEVGYAVVILDEGLALEGVRREVGELLTRGRSRAVSVVIAAQDSHYAPSQMHRQWKVLIAGQLQDQAAQGRLLEIASLPPRLLGVMQTIPQGTFLYLDRVDGSPMLALTRAPAERPAVLAASDG